MFSNEKDEKYFVAALQGIGKLLEGPDGKGKHSTAFTALSSRYHLHKAARHAEAFRAGADHDRDSGEHALAHAAARAIFAYACALQDEDVRA